MSALVGEEAVGCAGEAEGGGCAAEERALEEERHFGRVLLGEGRAIGVVVDVHSYMSIYTCTRARRRMFWR